MPTSARVSEERRKNQRTPSPWALPHLEAERQSAFTLLLLWITSSLKGRTVSFSFFWYSTEFSSVTETQRCSVRANEQLHVIWFLKLSLQKYNT